MRKPPLGPTAQQRVNPCVLLVSVGDPNEALYRQCATQAAGARLEVCDVASVTTRAAELRPLALLVPSEILEFDPSEFVALARTVDSALIPLETAQPVRQMQAQLLQALKSASQRPRS